MGPDFPELPWAYGPDVPRRYPDPEDAIADEALDREREEAAGVCDLRDLITDGGSES